MLADNGIYELLNGIICMSPRPSTFHQRILTRLSIEIGKYLENQRPLETLVQN